MINLVPFEQAEVWTFLDGNKIHFCNRGSFSGKGG